MVCSPRATGTLSAASSAAKARNTGRGPGTAFADRQGAFQRRARLRRIELRLAARICNRAAARLVHQVFCLVDIETDTADLVGTGRGAGCRGERASDSCGEETSTCPAEAENPQSRDGGGGSPRMAGPVRIFPYLSGGKEGVAANLCGCGRRPERYAEDRCVGRSGGSGHLSSAPGRPDQGPS